MKFVDFCCNDIVPKSQFDFLERLNPQPRKGNKPFSTFYNHYDCRRVRQGQENDSGGGGADTWRRKNH